MRRFGRDSLLMLVILLCWFQYACGSLPLRMDCAESEPRR